LAPFPFADAVTVVNLVRQTVALAAIVVTSLASAPAGTAQLTTESPFLPAAGAGGADAVAKETLELHGIVCRSEGAYFCIYDAVKKKSVGWVGLNEPGHGLVVRSYDAANNAIVVETPDGNKQLKLSKVTIVPARGPVAAAIQPTNSANPVIGGAETITPDERQARIRANFIAERERQMAQERAANAQRTSAAAAAQ